MNYGYPFYGYPPPMLGPPQGGPQINISQEAYEKGLAWAAKMEQRKIREKERELRNKERKAKEDKRESRAAVGRTFLFVEWYILGILSYPLWAPMYRAFMTSHGVQ